MLFALLAKKGKGASMSNMVHRLFFTDMGAKVVSAIFGFALATMFQRICKDRACVVIQPPPMDEIQQYVYRNGDKCYQYVPRVVKCVKE